MKSARRFTLLTCMIMLVLLTLVGCWKGDSVASVALLNHSSDTVIEIAPGDFDYNAYTVVVTYESGTTEEIALTEEMISETDLFKLYQIGEHDITVNYGDSQYTFKVSVKRNSFGELTFPENNVFTYNGEVHTVEVDGEIPANAVVTYIGGNSFVNAGTYDVTAVVSCEGYVTQKLSTTVKIERAKYDISGVKFEGKEVVYDGSSHSVAISGNLPDGVSSPIYTINGKSGSSAIDAGEYTVKATFVSNDPNYEAIPAMEATLKITPAEYTVKGVDVVFKGESGNVISSETKIYDGKSVTFDLNDYSKLSKKITVSFAVCDKDGKVISTSNKKTNILEVGVYTVRVEFTMADGNNYKPIPPIERTFEVLKAEYPSLQNIQFVASQSQYDGKAHSLVIEGQLPAGVTVSYEYYKDGKLLVDGADKPVQSVVDVGRYTVKAIFTHTDTNRDEIAPLSAVLNITAAKFNVSNLGAVLNGTDVYDGTEKAVAVTGQLPDEINAVVIYYKNGQIMENADGSYVSSVIEPGEYYVCVQFVSASNNYVISGMLEYAFTITKAIINLDGIESDGAGEYIYNGESQSPSIKNGTVPNHVNATEQLFSVDANGNRTAVDSAVNVGNYVKVVTVTLDDPTRYQLSNSGVIEWAFEITPKLIDVGGISISTDNLTYNENDQKPNLIGVPEHVLATVTVYTYGGSEAIENTVDVGRYRCEVILRPENSNYELSAEKLITEYEISPITIVDIDSLSEDFYVEAPDNDGLYVWSEDDAVIKNAISTAIFGEYSNYAKVDSLRTPHDATTNTWLTSNNNSIDPNTIYDIKCDLSVGSNYRIFYDGQLRSGKISLTIRVKFIINNNI